MKQPLKVNISSRELNALGNLFELMRSEIDFELQRQSFSIDFQTTEAFLSKIMQMQCRLNKKELMKLKVKGLKNDLAKREKRTTSRNRD